MARHGRSFDLILETVDGDELLNENSHCVICHFRCFPSNFSEVF